MKINNQKIRELMEEQRLTAYELSLKMKVREQWVYTVLSGNAGRTFKTAEKFAKGLNVHPEEIIDWEQEAA